MTDQTESGGGSLDPSPAVEGVRSEWSDSRWIAVGLVETINGGKSQPKQCNSGKISPDPTEISPDLVRSH